MRTATLSQINRYYKLYSHTDVVFNSRVIRFLGLLTRNIYIKNRLETTACVIYSSSMAGARIIADLSPSFFATAKLDNNVTSLHFSFETYNRPHPFSIFVPSKIEGFSKYQNNESKNYHLISLSYIKRPPDDLVGMLGRIVESNANAQKWKDVRITAFPRTMREIDLDSSDTIIELDSKPTKCIIRNLSFNGAKVVLEHESRKLANTTISLYMPFGSQKELIKIKGEALRFEELENRTDLVGLSIVFDEENIPLAYTTNLNEYLIANQVRDD